MTRNVEKNKNKKYFKGTRFHLAYDEWTCSVRISLFSLFSNNSSIFFYCATTREKKFHLIEVLFTSISKRITFEWRIIENCWLMRLLIEMELRFGLPKASKKKFFPFSAISYSIYWHDRINLRNYRLASGSLNDHIPNLFLNGILHQRNLISCLFVPFFCDFDNALPTR